MQGDDTPTSVSSKTLSVTCGDSSPKGRAKGAVHRCVAAPLSQPFFHHYFILLGFARMVKAELEVQLLCGLVALYVAENNRTAKAINLTNPKSDVVILQPPSILA